MQKIDYKKELKHLYMPSPKGIELVDVPEINFLMIDGVGDPNTCQECMSGRSHEEGPTIERLHEYIQANGYTLAGKHHEIYLSDIRKAAPANWKTVIRQPIGSG